MQEEKLQPSVLYNCDCFLVEYLALAGLYGNGWRDWILSPESSEIWVDQYEAFIEPSGKELLLQVK